MLNGMKKHKDKEQGKINPEAARSINRKATPNENNTRFTALERSVA